MLVLQPDIVYLKTV